MVAVCVIKARSNDRIDRTPVDSLDLARYMGTWYEIARYDHRFERGLTGIEARYELLPNGRVDVVNCGVDMYTGKVRRVHGKAHAGSVPGQLRVSFFWFFYADYNVLEVGEDYDWALVGSRSSKYLWILSRTPVLPSRTFNHILRLAERRGYPTGPLLFVGQG